MLRIIIEQDTQVETDLSGQTTIHRQQIPARNGGPPALGPQRSLHSSLSRTPQHTARQYAGGTAQNAGTAPSVLQARRKL